MTLRKAKKSILQKSKSTCISQVLFHIVCKNRFHVSIDRRAPTCQAIACNALYAIFGSSVIMQSAPFFWSLTTSAGSFIVQY